MDSKLLFIDLRWEARMTSLTNGQAQVRLKKSQDIIYRKLEYK